MNKTSIEWTDFTWNPIRARTLPDESQEIDCDCPCELCAPDQPHCGKKPCDVVKIGTFCTRISPGCTNCYASTINRRFGNGLEYTVPNLEKVEFYIDEKILAEPLHRKKPARIFVGDMFDLFHEAIDLSLIHRVIEVAEWAERHTFQFLTKRAARMQEVFNFRFTPDAPPPHICGGVSIEDQKRADERIPLLERTALTVRFLSVEPMLEEIYIEPELMGQTSCGRPDWVICGGESGPGSRPFNLAWAESLLKQCRAAEVPFFMKQLGSVPVIDDSVWRDCCDRGRVPLLSAKNAQKTKSDQVAISLRDSKGGDPSEWPEHLRVREFPSPKLVNA